MTAPSNDNPSGTDNQIILSLSKDPGPVTESARITSLDLIRGVAVLGILLMNAVSFRYGLAPYLNLSAGGSDTPLDWAIGIFGEIFIDQKFMALFSLLFGAGILLFIERARQREQRPILLNLWRNALLLGIGILHSLIWDGDVLIVYAVSALFLIALSKLPAKALIAIGALVFLLSIPNFLLMQYIADNSAAPLTGVWEPTAQGTPETPSQPQSGNPQTPSDATPSPPTPPQSGNPQNLPGTMLSLTLLGYFARGLGLILMGAGLYRLGFMQGDLPPRTYRLTAAIGLTLGIPLAAAGAAITHLNDYSREIAFIGQIPNTAGTIPAALGLMSLIILWHRQAIAAPRLKQRLQSAGRMALTNYLTQTILGILILTIILDTVPINRAAILAFCIAIWALQLWWSPVWLTRHRFGPAEWLWRTATYRRRQPLRRQPAPNRV